MNWSWRMADLLLARAKKSFYEITDACCCLLFCCCCCCCGGVIFYFTCVTLLGEYNLSGVLRELRPPYPVLTGRTKPGLLWTLKAGGEGNGSAPIMPSFKDATHMKFGTSQARRNRFGTTGIKSTEFSRYLLLSTSPRENLIRPWINSKSTSIILPLLFLLGLLCLWHRRIP